MTDFFTSIAQSLNNFIVTYDLTVKFVILCNTLIIIYFIGLCLVYTILLFSSFFETFREFKAVKVGNIMSIVKSHVMLPVTVLIPVHNEEVNILELVASVLKSNYANISILIVNDGSTDRTLATLIETFKLYPVSPIIKPVIKTLGSVKAYYMSKSHRNITVIDTEHSDKSDSLNMGLNACRTPFLITVDGDSMLDPDSIGKLMFYALSKQHPVIVGGAVYGINGCTYKDGIMLEKRMSLRPIFALQSCEYLRSFLSNRPGWNAFGGALCYSGTFTLFEHRLLQDLGGFSYGNMGEDCEIIIHAHADRREKKYPYEILFTATASAWTELPSKWGHLFKQRMVWQIGALQSLMKYKRMLFNPRYGIIGMFNYPVTLIFETMSAVIETLGYIALPISYCIGWLSIDWLILFLAVSLGFSVLLTMSTALINFITFNEYRKLSDLLWILFFSVIEILGYHQCIAFARTYATFKYLFMEDKGKQQDKERNKNSAGKP